jgi:hypothetical protein
MNEEENVQLGVMLSEPPIEHTTACEHYWVEDMDQDPFSNLVSVRCTKCWGGCMINPKITSINEGKLCQQENQ